MLPLVTLLIIDLIYQSTVKLKMAKSSPTDICIGDAKGCFEYSEGKESLAYFPYWGNPWLLVLR